MNHVDQLLNTVKQLSVPGKGILAADESTKTIAKRLATIGVENTETNRRDYREMLFSTKDLQNYISGVILFEETLTQASHDGTSLGQLIANNGIVPGIKVDKGLVDLPYTNEKITQGLDGLEERIIQYKKDGARFAKWRAVFNIADNLPSHTAIHANAHALGRYAGICQKQGIVPIVEPELLMDGKHTIERCFNATETVLHHVFHELHLQGIILEGIVLKPSMVIPGSECEKQASVAEVANATVQVLQRTVPAAVPTINFLSGGQSAELATQHLNAMNQCSNLLPWQLSFSYGRALQAPSLELWRGKAENVAAAQNELHKRAKLNGAAAKGEYKDQMEQAA